ncbi:nuclear transport factor 2 family protein [Microlunatus soli]|uniref:Ketosteroid isomerase homolog n=1 Tax=Microlunatus soli TaxID=630515 RepID=A0A1H1V3X5_9ACTN|nr:nuclear transport factor 2 family protein [Microlunatus soli]SDS79201.1 Ketosteroid isomerase homolog [Microlunatus soli]
MEQQTTADEAALRDLGRRWAEAEVAKDLDTLDAMAHPELKLVGPLGFILDRNAWVHRYATGDLETTELTWDQVEIRTFGDVAIAIGRQHQQAAYRGTPNNGDFRISHVFVRDPQARFGWLIAHVQLSQMVAPPGGAPAGPPTGDRS